VDSDKFPWQIQAAKLMEPSDAHGNKMFLRAVDTGEYDIVWILNDMYVTTRVAEDLHKIILHKKKKGLKVPTIIYYYPVDCQVVPEGGAMLKVADINVAYTEHGARMTRLSMPEVAQNLKEIPHGVDSSIFKPISKEKALKYRKEALGADEDTFVIANVNRNTTRKQIPYSLLAFKEFRKTVPNSVYYIHAAFHDQGGDLLLAARDLGFELSKDVIFPVNYGPGNGVSDYDLNCLYNSADMFLSTHLGEGWGLTISEAMAAGTPVIVPNNTCMPQLVGEDGDRGYLYPCKDTIWVDNSGFREKGMVADIVDKMLTFYENGSKYDEGSVNFEISRRAREWAVEHDWNEVVKNWIRLFDTVGAVNTGIVRFSASSSPVDETSKVGKIL
jgi:glycosyltransferase involved in cell wall biosynthesis